MLIFRGKLLDPAQTLADAGLVSGCVLHLTLNEAPAGGKPLHVRDSKGVLRTILCGEDYTVEDVKEEIACFPG